MRCSRQRLGGIWCCCAQHLSGSSHVWEIREMSAEKNFSCSTSHTHTGKNNPSVKSRQRMLWATRPRDWNKLGDSLWKQKKTLMWTPAHCVMQPHITGLQLKPSERPEPACVHGNYYSINLIAVIVSVRKIYSLCSHWTLQSCDKLVCEWESLLQMKNNDADPPFETTPVCSNVFSHTHEY